MWCLSIRFRRRLRSLAGAVSLALSIAATPASAAETTTKFTVGRSISAILDDLNHDEATFVYSVSLLPLSVRVLSEPGSDEIVAKVTEVLAPHGLVVKPDGKYFLVVRDRASDSSGTNDVDSTGAAVQGPVLEVITVSASRYELAGRSVRSPVRINQRAIESFPDLGDDPVRALQRLPGAAAGGTSAKSHFRGGDENETGIILNGYRLLDPFHVRDYHSLFSAIDTRALEAMEVYTGGFPVRYGDRMSGLVLIDSLTPEKPRRTELGLSVFNTSALSAGRFKNGEGRWLVSGRRSNLGLVLNPRLGEPNYHDFFGELSLTLAPRTTLTVNGLLADDQVIVATESDVGESENSRNDTDNSQLWLKLDNDWNDALRTSTVISSGSLDSLRVGVNSQPDKIDGSVRDQREVEVYGVRQDWSYELSNRHRLTFGAQYQHVRGAFRYAAQAEYLDFYAAFESTPDFLQRDLTADVAGESYSFYVADRWQMTKDFAAEIGVRWDKQTYTTDPADEQVSPRLSLLYRINRDTELRASAGRFYQSHEIHELQIEDGVTSYFPAQRADHFIVGLQHHFNNGYAVRAEIYSKEMRRLRPRYENLFDPLAIIPELEPGRVRVAPERASSEGLELSLSYDREKALSWWASYVVARVEDKMDGVRIARNWDQRHAIQAGLIFNHRNWEFSAAANLHSGWPTTPLLLGEASTPDAPVLEIGQRNTERFASYATLDLRLSRTFRLRKGSLNAFVEISNASNRRNPCCSDYDLEPAGSPGNDIVLTRADEYWLPLLPALGVLWEF